MENPLQDMIDTAIIADVAYAEFIRATRKWEVAKAAYEGSASEFADTLSPVTFD